MTFCSNCGTKLAAQTRFCQECGSPVSWPENGPPAPASIQPEQSEWAPPQKKKGRLALILSLAGLGLLLIAVAVFFGVRGWPGAGGSQDEAKWQAVWIEMPGLSQSVAEIFPDGLTLELAEGGRFLIILEGEQASGRWQLQGDELSLTGRTLKTRGRIDGAQLILDDLFGYRFIFYKQGETYPQPSEGPKEQTDSPDSLPQGAFTAETKTISAAGVTLTYPVTAKAAENLFGLPSVELPAGYWVNAAVETAFDGPEQKKASLEFFTTYKGGRLFSSSFRDLPCVVLMHDTDQANSADAAINVFIYINDEQLVQINVISRGGELAAMLADQDLWALIHSVTWQ